jgi:hypothetical protein
MTVFVAALAVGFFSVIALAIPPAVQAVCPVCTVAVAAGLGLSRYLGIDDTVSGVWFGGLIVSTGLWLANWLRAKQVKLPFLYPLSVGGMFALTVGPMFFMDIVGHPLNTLWGIDKLILGLSVGAGLFLASVVLDKLLRSMHEGKVYLPYQKVILPVSFLTISSLLFYFITRV